MLPSLVSQLVVILKDTALGYIITYSELIRAGQNLSTTKGNLIPTLIVLAAMFIVINYTADADRRQPRGAPPEEPRARQRCPSTAMADPAMTPGSRVSEPSRT